MTTHSTMPSDEDLDRITERLLPAVVARTARRPRRRRALGIGLSALAAGGMFAAGLAVGGATAAPASSPALTINCYDSSGTLTNTDSFAQPDPSASAIASGRLASAVKDPAGDCSAMTSDEAQNTAIITAINQLRAAGSTCGTLTSQDGQITTFRDTGDHNSYTALSGPTIRPLPAPCAQVSFTAPAQTPELPMVACTLSPTAAAVYPATGDLSSFCATKGLTPWTS